MTSLDNLTAEQKRQELQAFYAKQQKTLGRGKAIIVAIAAFAILGSIYDAIVLGFSGLVLVGMVINICCAIALLNGFSWVRYFYIAVFVFGAFAAFFAISEIEMQRRAEHNVPTILYSWDAETGTATPNHFTPLLTPHYEPPPPPSYFIATYVRLAILTVVYTVCAIVLKFSKSVKEYLYAARH
ncbi:MAG: hypothetical protein FWB80_11465 [Defluviitaleaceae bacterium]|nr:hypothetical protein [Defluviitaleaceae bacterium]